MEEGQGQKFSRIVVWGSIFLYSLLFPFVFWCSLFSFMLVGHCTVGLGWFLVSLCISVPISMLIAVGALLSSCAQQQYRRALWYVPIPVLYCAGLLILLGYMSQSQG